MTLEGTCTRSGGRIKLTGFPNSPAVDAVDCDGLVASTSQPLQLTAVTPSGPAADIQAPEDTPVPAIISTFPLAMIVVPPDTASMAA